MTELDAERPINAPLRAPRVAWRAALVAIGLVAAATVRSRFVARTAPASAAGGEQAKFPAVRRFNRDYFNPLLLTVTAALRSDYPTVVYHRGRRSGKVYATPVFSQRFKGGFLVPLTYGPATDWAKNVRAAGGCELERGGRRYRTEAPRLIDHDQARALSRSPWPAIWQIVGIRDVLLLPDRSERASGPPVVP